MGLEACRRDAMLGDKRLQDRIGACLRKFQVALDAAHVVRVADDKDVKRGIGLQKFRGLFDRIRRLRLDRRLRGVKIDAFDRYVARSPDILMHWQGSSTVLNID